MNPITWIHIAGGMVALGAGTAAFALRKGGSRHAAFGQAFVAAMFVLGVTASILEPLKSPPESPIGGLVVCYFVATAWMAARRREGVPGRFEKIACAAVLAMGVAVIARGFELSAVPTRAPPGPGPLFGFGAVCVLAGLGDLRWLIRGRMTAVQRITRHLWRMCFAFFIATGSFFLGQQQVLPQAVRGSMLLVVLALAPFALMLFWLVRVRFAGTRLLPSPTRAAKD